MLALLLSLTGCGILKPNVVGDFCDVYREVDMPSSEAVKLDRKYQDRIIANEIWHFNKCM